ncbi:unnamed protein product [Amoebophrya sp. A120]|nr:unnamed protein product [Amoebophrya sp. A120]|eukprot:GSA120T00008158001.1
MGLFSSGGSSPSSTGGQTCSGGPQEQTSRCSPTGGGGQETKSFFADKPGCTSTAGEVGRPSFLARIGAPPTQDADAPGRESKPSSGDSFDVSFTSASCRTSRVAEPPSPRCIPEAASASFIRAHPSLHVFDQIQKVDRMNRLPRIRMTSAAPLLGNFDMVPKEDEEEQGSRPREQYVAANLMTKTTPREQTFPSSPPSPSSSSSSNCFSGQHKENDPAMTIKPKRKTPPTSPRQHQFVNIKGKNLNSFRCNKRHDGPHSTASASSRSTKFGLFASTIAAFSNFASVGVTASLSTTSSSQQTATHLAEKQYQQKKRQKKRKLEQELQDEFAYHSDGVVSVGTTSDSTNLDRNYDTDNPPTFDIVTKSSTEEEEREKLLPVFWQEKLKQIKDDVKLDGLEGRELAEAHAERQLQVAAVWQNVCTEDAYQQFRKELCPPTFPVSVLAYNPSGPGVTAKLTIILRPSITLKQVANSVELVALTFALPGFGLPSNLKPHPTDPNKRQIEVTGTNQPAVGENPTTAYNTDQNGLFETPAYFDFVQYSLQLKVKDKYEILHSANANLELCCFVLPDQLSENPLDFTLIASQLSYVPNELGTEPTNSYTLPENGTPQPIKAVPQIIRVNYFTHVEVRFDPALSNAESVVSIKVQVNSELRNGARIVAYLPDLTRNIQSESWQNFLSSSSATSTSDMTGNVGFQTEGSDWVLFEYFAMYNDTSKALTFFLRTDSVLPPSKMITFKTIKDDFILPNSLPSNSNRLKVAAFSYDGVDEVIQPTPVFQSDRIQEMRMFLQSRLQYSSARQNAEMTKTYVDVTLTFQTNTPLWKDSLIYLRLPGFSAEIIEVPLVGSYIQYFRNQEAVFDLARNELTVKVIRTLYSQAPNLISVTFVDLQIPPAMYENDPSLLIWNRDWDGVESPKRSIMASTAINNGQKEFTRSEIRFSPNEPDVVSNVTFTIQPSIVFYQGDEVLLYLYGFRCSSREIVLTGADAFRFYAYGSHSRGDWTQSTYTLTLRVREGHILHRTQATVFRIEINQGFRLPDKLSENDGILNIEGRGAYIAKEMLKKTPALGGKKYITNSEMVFESAAGPQGTLSNSIARVMFNFKANSDIRPNSTIIITMGGLTRDVGTGNLESGIITLSGKNAPMFAYTNITSGAITYSSGYWDSVSSELRAQIIPNLAPVPAGVETIFFIEYDQRFKLPFAMYLNDPSLKIAVPAAGIPQQLFNFTTRVNDMGKQFTESQLSYGAVGSVAHPNSPMDLTIEFATNVALPSGTTIRLTLPGFICAVAQPKLEPPPGESLLHYSYFSRRTVQVTTTAANGATQVLDVIEYFGEWNQEASTLDLTLRAGEEIPPNQVHKMTIKSNQANVVFRLPSRLDPNDPRLTIQTTTKQIIKSQPIRSSPQVVDRSFDISTFSYDPRNARSTFMFSMMFKPTVDIGPNDDIVLRLYGFTNALGNTKIHMTGPDAAMIEGYEATWNPTTQDLTISIAQGQVLRGNQTLSLTIQESQGFQLPATLEQDDPELKIKSGVNNIKQAKVKNSPMVGDGPHLNQRFCMYQYETGTRTIEPRMSMCTINQNVVTNPCSTQELQEGGCFADLAPDGAPVPLKIRGFQLEEADRVGFVPLDEQCPPVPDNFRVFANLYGTAPDSNGNGATVVSARRLRREERRRELEELLKENPAAFSPDGKVPEAALEHSSEWLEAEVKKHDRIMERLEIHAANARQDRALRRRQEFMRTMKRELRQRLEERRTAKMNEVGWAKCGSSEMLCTAASNAAALPGGSASSKDKELDKRTSKSSKSGRKLQEVDYWGGIRHWSDIVESRELDEMIFAAQNEVLNPAFKFASYREFQTPGEPVQRRELIEEQILAGSSSPSTSSSKSRGTASKKTQADREIDEILDQLDAEILRRIHVEQANFGKARTLAALESEQTKLEFSVETERALENAAFEIENAYWAAKGEDEGRNLEGIDIDVDPEEDVPSSAEPRVLTTATATTTIDALTLYQAFYNYDPFAELRFFSNYTSRELSQGADELTFHGVTGLEAGFFRICVLHRDIIYDVGMVIVRPSCPPGKVAVDGTVCVTHCPPDTIPVAGRCENEETYGYSDPAFFIDATASQLKPGRTSPIFIEPGTNLSTTQSTVATSEAEALAQNVVQLVSTDASASSTSSSGAMDASSAAATSPDVDPNMQLHMVGHRVNPYLNGTTYTLTTTKGGVEDIYSRTLMVPIKMSSPEAVNNMIWNRSDEHPERKYYVYRFTYELGQLLGVSSETFVVASISEARTGTGAAATTEGVIVNTIFRPSSDGSTRSADELLQLLDGLKVDIQSALHEEDGFFKNIFRDFPLRSIFVSLCPDNIYRSICPYMDSIMDPDIGFIIYTASVFGIALMLALFLFGAWRCDHDPSDSKKDDKKFFEKASKGDPKLLDPGLQNEYARSWLEDRYMGDEV